MPQVLIDSKIQEKLQNLEGWKREGHTITRTFKFKDFLQSMDFVNKLVEPAEEMNHHPDIEISYNEVKLALTTHSEGGITDNDFQLAQQVNNLTP